MKANRLITQLCMGLLAVFLLSSCSHPIRPNLVGFSFLQDSETPMDSVEACLSMQNLRSTGANSVVFVPFMAQASTSATNVTKSDAVTDEQLQAALQFAKQNELHLVLKPQILVKDSWAGEIAQATPEKEKLWFESYSQLILNYAATAETYHADAFVIGTELRKLHNSQHWPTLIKKIRKQYSGKITYAAGEIEGIKTFQHWQLLDAIGVTLYPDMTQAEITDKLTAQLQAISLKKARPVWILEIGMPSAQGWESHPWDWRGLEKSSPPADAKAQANFFRRWLTSLEKFQAKEIEGVWIWQWSSSPQAGGSNDIGYTVQNKSAQAVIQKHWRPPYRLLKGKIGTCSDS